MKNIGILGSGIVATTLGDGFIKQGHAVMLGTTHPGKLAEWQAKAGPDARVGSMQEAAAFGELLVLAVKGNVAVHLLRTLDAQALAGKTIIDATNPISDTPPENGVLHFFTNFDESLMEECQAAVPGAHFVKAFSCVGAGLMVQPDFGGVQPSMFICGNAAAAKAEVAEVVRAFGHEPEDMGGAEAARAIEPLCILWCIPGFRSNEWAHAFKMLKKSTLEFAA
ncbi:NAD(P)-binding domain-containing protein [Hymenobacter sp. BT683]|uniref:NAD(P)-binding domain-containing protein n=1 Tax=Hymenobacter jeongseonensis TaxID=2791027 RepID=A0ABS0IFN7_9BACT|nr:NAD(P)-binding domain-containing protein [Hymenobacter jeongseonensis]MBF9237165.1 NAD(P)-binding domain-containing protein [Hymenobacter jeongseonensis]